MAPNSRFEMGGGAGWKSGFASLAVHGGAVAILLFALSDETPSVRGSAGLAGASRTRFDMTVSQPSATEKKTEKPVAPIREGLPVPRLDRELPTEVKNAKPREIDSPPIERTERSGGDSSDAPAGTPGQGGSGDTRADAIGNAERSNALGIYLAKMQRKIQSNLEPAGYLAFEYRAVLSLALRKNGHVDRITVLTSSGDRTLDQKAVTAVKRSLPFDPWEYDQTIHVPVIFRATD